MLSDDEKRFMLWWEKNREREKRVLRQWIIGLPAGALFGIAIAINFSSGWYKRAEYTANSQFNPMVLVVAVLLIVSFMAIFSKRHKWDMNEQRYLEFKAKRDKDEEHAAKSEN